MPVVRLIGLLTTPYRIDWNDDGVIGKGDQWVEIYNGGETVVDLSGWSLQLVEPPAEGPATATPAVTTTAIFAFPTRTTLQPDSGLIVYRADTDLALQTGLWLMLQKPDGTLADSVLIPTLRGDASYMRGADGQWYVDVPIVPEDRFAPGGQ